MKKFILEVDGFKIYIAADLKTGTTTNIKKAMVFDERDSATDKADYYQTYLRNLTNNSKVEVAPVYL